VSADVTRTRQVLKGLNIPMTETEVLLVEMPNRPGAMADLCAKLNSNHISIKYAYVTSGAAGGRTIGIFKVDNLRKALKVTADRNNRRKEKPTLRLKHGAARR
jgi:hypothetical protein